MINGMILSSDFGAIYRWNKTCSIAQISADRIMMKNLLIMVSEVVSVTTHILGIALAMMEGCWK